MSPISPHTADSVAGYTLIERIGAGGYGEVWKAEAPGGLAKAVKLVYGYLDDQRAACERKSLNRIKEARHPFLLSLERIEIVDGQLVVVTELADMSLKERFEECRSEGAPGIPQDELLVYMGDAADALDYMRESHGLQHLDVKPENLLVTSGRVKVADFGLVKSLQDEHASLLGGLTPQYAPPELFDGSPTYSSDQYSLAIVYQEMLTGKPPFPGRTAAQLAAQHLHSQPQLSPLSQGDRDAVARALAKKPSDRFASCREMVDALRNTDSNRTRTNTAKLASDSTSEDRSSDTDSISEKGTRPTRAASDLKQPVAPVHRPTQTLILDNGDCEPEVSEKTFSPPVDLPPATDPVRLPPIEVSADEKNSVPCLVLGIGGTAADVLRGLRKRILRDEKSFSQENLELLLLDTDGNTIESACGDRRDESLEFRETLHCPLRSSTEYREQSVDHLQWLSRRWLYNIPRSLQTEGRRPLGRLAFADHIARITSRIREALLSVADKVEVDETGNTSSGNNLKVVVVASVSGGAGGGIVPDIGYLVRQVMDEFGLVSSGVCAVLTHSTNSSRDQQDLSIANTYACLSELNHYAVHGYPGDPGCCLAPSDHPAFDDTYLVHLGDDLNASSYDAAVAKVADYLYLNAASRAGRFFDAARRSGCSSDVSSKGEIVLRTFGLIQFDPHHNEVTSAAVNKLSRSAVACWLGGDTFFDEQTVEEYLESRFPDLARTAESVKNGKGRSSVSELTENESGLRYLLDPEALQNVLSEAMGRQLGGDGTRVFRRWIDLALERKLAVKRAFLKELDRSLGPHRRPGDETAAPLSDLENSLAESCTKLAALVVESIRDALVSLTSDPDARLAGAQQLAQWLCDRLRQFERATSTEWTRTEERLSGLEASLPDRVVAGGSGFWQRKSRHGDTWIDYCQLRAHLIILESVVRFLRRVNTHLSDYREQLKELRFSLTSVSSQFDADVNYFDPAEQVQSDETEKKLLTQAIADLIQSRMPELVAKLDHSLGEELIQLETSPKTEEKEPLNAQRFARALRAKSWAILAESLRELDLANRLLAGNGQSIEWDRDCLPHAVPRLPKSGGGKRLLVIAPRTTDEATVRAGLKDCEEGKFSLMRVTESELILCYEVQDLSLPIIATRLTQHHENCIPAASRLHTRIDVQWPKRMSWQ